MENARRNSNPKSELSVYTKQIPSTSCPLANASDKSKGEFHGGNPKFMVAAASATRKTLYTGTS
jgi:hypothetical protein